MKISVRVEAMNGTNAKIKAVSTGQRKLTIDLHDGRVLTVPLSWFPSLLAASPAERRNWRLSGAGYGIHWPALDYDLSVEAILEGRKEHPNALRYTREARASKQRARKSLSRSKSRKPTPLAVA
jgi:hypothetical protein